MGQCREGKSEVPLAKASYKCGKCGARTTDPARVCQPQAVAPPSKTDDGKDPA